MSIFKKISILFIFSLILMSIIGFWTDSINSKRIDSLIKDKYIEISNEILVNINNEKDLNNIYLKYELEPILDYEDKNNEVFYFKKHTFGFISIQKESFDDELIIKIKYLDEFLILKTQDEENINDKLILNILIFIDIFILMLTFIYILNLLSPLKKITQKITSFANGDLSSRIDIKSNDEIGILSNSFNQMASSLQSLIQTREELLRDIGHELRTPIAKGKFAIEKIDDFSQKELLKKIFNDLEILTDELIELEKLNSNKLNISTFSSETLIIESLSKLYLDDESKIEIFIKNDFKINADLAYLSTALKNLIQNALKYSISFPIEIYAQDNKIIVKNEGEKLSKELEYYLRPFTQELSQRDGFGLGLSIVQKIISKHNFKLEYDYSDNKNIFTIII
ncbi:MAG: ArsS family sensor histidine kinase [Poseidonibacter sp.]|uniref:ArsS family sensor histidine kinase n=1 Tax=Poseidonibacter sp. TaxID=2321188 RepID=UPI00359E049A